MKDVESDTGVPPVCYCKPVNAQQGPCHAPDCDHRSGCVLRLKRQQHTKHRKTVKHQDNSGVPSPAAFVANVVTTRTNATQKGARVMNSSFNTLLARKTKHPPKPPRIETRMLKGEAEGVARMEPPTITPKGAVKCPLLLLLLPGLTLKSALRDIMPPHRSLTPRRGDWPGWPDCSWPRGWT